MTGGRSGSTGTDVTVTVGVGVMVTIGCPLGEAALETWGAAFSPLSRRSHHQASPSASSKKTPAARAIAMPPPREGATGGSATQLFWVCAGGSG